MSVHFSPHFSSYSPLGVDPYAFGVPADDSFFASSLTAAASTSDPVNKPVPAAPKKQAGRPLAQGTLRPRALDFS